MKIYAIVGKALYQKRMMAFFWMLGLAAMAIFMLAFFHTFRASFGTALDSLPNSLQKVVGTDKSFSIITGYVSQQVFGLRMPLLTIILAITLFNGFTAGDEQKGITETQLTLPLSRSKLLIGKTLTALCVLLIASIGAVVGVMLTVALIHEHYSLLDTVKLTLNCILLAGVFGMFAFMVGAITGRKALTVGLAGGLAFLSYLLTSLAASVSSLTTADKLSLFHYYKTGSPLELRSTLLFIVIALVFWLTGLAIFNRRDLNLR